MSSTEDPYNIKALQQQLLALYDTDVRRKLTVAHCVELVSKLISEGELDVLFSSDGKEYVTPKQLEAEIRSTLNRLGGRLQIIELGTQLNMELKFIEERVYDMLKRSKGNLTMTQEGELITFSYLEKVADEINELVHEFGQCDLSELARRFSLSVQMISSLVTQFLGSRIVDCKLNNTILYENALRDRYTAILRGTLRGAGVPLNLESTFQQQELQSELAWSCIEDLVSSGQVAGTIEVSSLGASRRQKLFVPRIFTLARSQWIASFFKSNGYILKESLEKMGITDLSKFSTLEPDAIPLETCVVSKSTVAALDGAISGSVHSGQPLDITSAIPCMSALSRQDLPALLAQCESLQNELKSKTVLVFDDTFVVPTSFIDPILPRYEQWYSSHLRVHGMASNQNPSAVETPEAKQQRISKLTHELTNQISEWYRASMESGDCAVSTLARHIAENLRPEVEKIRTRLSRALFVHSQSQSGAARDRGKVFQDKFDYIHMNISFFHLCLRELSDIELRNALDQYLCASMCQDLTLHLVARLAEENFVTTTPSDSRERILKQLPLDLARAIEALCAPTTASGFLDELERQRATLELQIRDIKPEKLKKSLVAHHKKSLTEQLSNLTDPCDPIVSFRLSISLLYLALFNGLLYTSSKLLPEMTKLCLSQRELPAKIRNLITQVESSSVTSEDEVSTSNSCAAELALAVLEFVKTSTKSKKPKSK